jgi:hypothetical protein
MDYLYVTPKSFRLTTNYSLMTSWKLIIASEQLRGNERQENSEVGHGNSVAALLSASYTKSKKEQEVMGLTHRFI